MEPRRPELNLGLEQPSASYGQNLEQTPEQTPAQQFEIGPQTPERHGEIAGGVVSTTTLPAPVVAPLPTPVVDDESQATTLAISDTPTVASDEDLIEKEWVDKAKKILAQTKDDPYRREQEVSKLQADYLRKRYGRELGASQ
jgi:Txe/YoeB family toxin of Txe-Axe toxin-antitoxin module